MDNMKKGKQMKNALKKPAKRAIRSARDRTQPDPAGVQKIKLFVKQLEKRPRDAFNNWLNFLNNAKKGDILDNARAQKLDHILKMIPLRTLKDAEQRILGQGDKISGMIKNLENQLKKIPRNALNLWKKFNEDAKRGAILDNLKAKELQMKLAKIPIRTLKDA